VPLKPHPTDPDKLIYKANKYNLQNPWQGLTDEEAEQIVDKYWNDPPMFIEAIEQALREKNT